MVPHRQRDAKAWRADWSEAVEISVQLLAGIGDVKEHWMPEDPFSVHEVVHTASLISELFDRAIVDHPFVAKNPKLRKRAENIAGLLGDFYQSTGQYVLGLDPDGSRPKFEKSIAERGPSATRVLNAVKRKSGMTELEIAKSIYGPNAIQQYVNADCRLLVAKGLVERRGAGGRGDPFTYFTAI